MTLLAARVALVRRLTDEIKNHPMCAGFSEDRYYFLVEYPAGDFPVHGTRASKSKGKAAALQRLLPIMERHWRESFPGYEGMK